MKFPAAFSKDEWGLQAHPSSYLRSAIGSLERGKFLVCFVGFGVFCRIPRWCLSVVLDGILSCPHFTSRNMRPITAQALAVSSGAEYRSWLCHQVLCYLAKNILQGPSGVPRTSGQEQRCQTGGLNHWHIFLTPSPGRQWKSTYTGWLIPPNNSNYCFC